MAMTAGAQTTGPAPRATLPSSYWGNPPCSTSPTTLNHKGVAWYYVSPTGNDKNTGLSPTAAFKTIQHAFSNNLLRPGDALLVEPGTYNEDIFIKFGGAAGACITLIGTGATQPVVTWSNDSAATINVWAPYVRVSNLAITHPEPNWNPALKVNTGSSAIETTGPYLPDAKGVLRPRVHHVQIDNNVVYGAGDNGITFEWTDYVYVYGNTVHDNAFSAGKYSGISIWEPVNLDSAPGYHNIVADNFSYGNTNRNPIAGPGYTTDENGIIIDDTRMTQALKANPNSGAIPYTGSTLIFGNVIFGNGGHGIEFYYSDNVDVFNNVVYQDLQDPEMQGYPTYAGGELDPEYSGHIRLENNIAFAPSSALPVLCQIGSATDEASNLWTHNISDVGFLSLDKPNAGDAQASVGYGVNPQFLAPTITNIAAAGYAFRVHSTSPAVGAGNALTFAVTDIAGSTLPAHTAPNIGAYVK
jgi:serralysin